MYYVDYYIINLRKWYTGILISFTHFRFENGFLGGFVLIRVSDKSIRVQILNSAPKELWKLKLFPRIMTKQKNVENKSNFERLRTDTTNFTSSSTPRITPNLYGQIYTGIQYTNSNNLKQVTVNPYYYNNWFYPNQMSPNMNFEYAKKFDMMQLTQPSEEYKLAMSGRLLSVKRYNPQLNNIIEPVYTNTYDYMKRYYDTLSNPVTQFTAYDVPNIVQNSKRDKDAENWIMTELNDTNTFRQNIEKRPYYESKRTLESSRSKKSTPSLYQSPKILNRYFYSPFSYKGRRR